MLRCISIADMTMDILPTMFLKWFATSVAILLTEYTSYLVSGLNVKFNPGGELCCYSGHIVLCGP